MLIIGISVFFRLCLSWRNRSKSRSSAIDAKADGNFYADCFLNMALEGAGVHTVITDTKGKKVAENTSDVHANSDHTSINLP